MAKIRHNTKYAGKHTTLTPHANQIYKLLKKSAELSRIAPGLIKNGQTTAATPTVKIAHQSGCVLLIITGDGAVQQVRVYTKRSDRIVELLVEALRKKGFLVSIRGDPE